MSGTNQGHSANVLHSPWWIDLSRKTLSPLFQKWRCRLCEGNKMRITTKNLGVFSPQLSRNWIWQLYYYLIRLSTFSVWLIWSKTGCRSRILTARYFIPNVTLHRIVDTLPGDGPSTGRTICVKFCPFVLLCLWAIIFTHTPACADKRTCCCRVCSKIWYTTRLLV